MNTSFKQTLHIFETALLLALGITLCFATWGRQNSTELTENLIRIHVIAVSDEPTEQALKLTVRDAVLAEAQPILDSAQNTEDAYAILSDNLSEIQTAALSVSDGRTVSVSLTQENYPTRDYETFSLPAGKYNSLKISLGEAEGENWWCVVYPPLCTSVATSSVETLSDTDNKTITFENEGYVLRFRAMELWGELSEFLD